MTKNLLLFIAVVGLPWATATCRSCTPETMWTACDAATQAVAAGHDSLLADFRAHVQVASTQAAAALTNAALNAGQTRYVAAAAESLGETCLDAITPENLRRATLWASAAAGDMAAACDLQYATASECKDTGRTQ